MSDVLNFILGIALLIFCAYVLIFGGIGALLARHRGGSPATGFVVGLVPLIGWPLVLFITRASKRQLSADQWLHPRSGIDDSSRGGAPTPLVSGTTDAAPTSADPHDY